MDWKTIAEGIAKGASGANGLNLALLGILTAIRAFVGGAKKTPDGTYPPDVQILADFLTSIDNAEVNVDAFIARMQALADSQTNPA